MITDITKCVHCHKCRDHCAFLKKYNIDIGDGDKLRELAYHCFQCGTCTTVCPVHIDGKAVILEMRRDRVQDGSAGLDDKRYRFLLWEKKDYRFRNYKHAEGSSVLFPGCNFPSMYPRTMKVLEDLLRDKAGIGTVYDCCGKPVAELGLREDEDRIIAGINERLKEHGITEVIMVCPNCYYFLQDRLDARVVSIYEKMQELGIGRQIKGGGRIFLPCPDRESGELLRKIESLYAGEPYEEISGVQCCGLGGSAGIREPELAKAAAEQLTGTGRIHVYCASCAGKLARSGSGDVTHVLTEILGTNEKPDIRKSAVNRVLTRFR